MDAPVVLLVAGDASTRQDIAGWLEEGGFDVVACPGPTAPEYSCIGGRGGRCVLAEGADAVVLDLRLDSDVLMRGTPGWQLMLRYLEWGRPVVALAGAEDPVRPRAGAGLTVLPRPPERDALVDAVREALRGT